MIDNHIYYSYDKIDDDFLDLLRSQVEADIIPYPDDYEGFDKTSCPEEEVPKNNILSKLQEELYETKSALKKSESRIRELEEELNTLKKESEEQKNTNTTPPNHICALAFAMVARHRYKFSARADFVKYARENYDEFKQYKESQLVCAINDLVKKNKKEDFTSEIKDQESMIKYIEGCYTKTKGGKESKECSKMKSAANDYFFELKDLVKTQEDFL